MPNGSGLLGNYSSTQSGVIVPKPGSTTQFYIFTVDAQAGDPAASTTLYGGAAYSIVDMTLNGGNGDVTTKNVQLLAPTCEKVTAVRHCNGRDIWVLIHDWNSNSFYVYSLTSTGLSAPIVTSIGDVQFDAGSGFSFEALGYMKFSPNGKKLALASYTYLNEVQIFDFDNSTGQISNPNIDTNFPISFDAFGSPLNGVYGLTFSPDNSKLYVGETGYSPHSSKVYQYNMLAGSNLSIRNSRTVVHTTADRVGGLQIGPDGKIYVAKVNASSPYPADYLDVINNPNGLGAACNYVNQGLYLGGSGQSYYGLPDMVESFTAVPYTASLAYSTCTGNNTLTFNDTILNGTISVLWNFGDPASGTADTSTQQSPTHTFHLPARTRLVYMLATPAKRIASVNQ